MAHLALAVPAVLAVAVHVSPRRIVQYAGDRSAADAIKPGELAQALATAAIADEGVAIDVEWRPADTLALQPGAAHAGAYPLDDQVAFQFGDGADDHDDGAAQRAAGIDVLAEADELDVEVAELVEYLQKCVTERASRSKAQTMTTSNRPRRASAII